jgi:hypothetical protein
MSDNQAPAPVTPAPTWRDTLPDPIKTHESLAHFKDINALAESYINTKAMVGKKAYALPEDSWKPEQWNEWHKTIGVPDAPDKYGAPPEEMLTKAGLNKEVLASAQKRFHELGLTPRQVKGIMEEWYLPTAIKGSEVQAQQAQQEREASSQKLQSELTQLYGDKKDAKVGLVKAVLSKFGSPELVEWAEKSGAGNDPGFVKSLIKMGEAMLEDSTSRGGGGGDLGPAASRANALKEIDAMMANRVNDPAFAAKFEDPKSAERVKWAQLHDIAYPKPQAA